MSLGLFDNAIVSKFQSVFKNTVYTPVDEFPETPTYPLITIYRLENVPNFEEFFSFTAKHEGISEIRQRDQVKVRLKKLSFLLTYQVDLYATDRDILDDLFVELCFFFNRKSRDFSLFSI